MQYSYYSNAKPFFPAKNIVLSSFTFRHFRENEKFLLHLMLLTVFQWGFDALRCSFFVKIDLQLSLQFLLVQQFLNFVVLETSILVDFFELSQSVRTFGKCAIFTFSGCTCPLCLQSNKAICMCWGRERIVHIAGSFFEVFTVATCTVEEANCAFVKSQV